MNYFRDKLPATQTYAPLKSLSELLDPKSADGYTILSSLATKVELVSTQTKVLGGCVLATQDLCTTFKSLLQQLKGCLWGKEDIRKLQLDADFKKYAKQTYRQVFPEIEAVLHEIFQKYDIIRQSSKEKHDDITWELLIILISNEIMDDLASLLRKFALKLQEIGIGALFSPTDLATVKRDDRAALLERLTEIIESPEGKKLFKNEVAFAQVILDELKMNKDPKELTAKAVFKELEDKRALFNLYQEAAKKCEFRTANMGQEEFELEDEIIHAGTFGPMKRGILQGHFYQDEPRIITKEINRLNFLSIEARREIQVHSIRYRQDNFSSPFLSHFFGTLLVEEDNMRSIFLVYAEYPRSLSTFLWSEHFVDVNAEPLRNRRVLKFATDIVEGLTFLHSNSVHHGALNPSNIFMVQDEQLVLSNFGFESTKKEYRRMKNYNAMTYLAPESIRPRRQQWTFAGDVYSFAVILWELVEGKKAFEDIEFSKLIRMISKDRMRPKFTTKSTSSKLPSFMRDMINACWEHHPANRPTASEMRDRIKNQIVEAERGSRRASFMDWYNDGEFDVPHEPTLSQTEPQVVPAAEPRVNHEGMKPAEMVKALDAQLEPKIAIDLLIEIYSVAINDRLVRAEVVDLGIGPLLRTVMQNMKGETDVMICCLKLIWCLGKGQRKAAVEIEEKLVGQLVHQSIVECMHDHEDEEEIQIEGYNALRELCLKSETNVEKIAATNAVWLCYRQLKKGDAPRELAKNKEAIRLLSYLLASKVALERALTLRMNEDGRDALEILLDANVGEDQDASLEFFGGVVLDQIREYMNSRRK